MWARPGSARPSTHFLSRAVGCSGPTQTDLGPAPPSLHPFKPIDLLLRQETIHISMQDSYVFLCLCLILETLRGS